jgi:hypothetical protein
MHNIVHLVGIYLLLLSLMHGIMNLKFANAKQAKKRTNIGTSNKNCTRQQQPSGLIKRAGKEA